MTNAPLTREVAYPATSKQPAAISVQLWDEYRKCWIHMFWK